MPAIEMESAFMDEDLDKVGGAEEIEGLDNSDDLEMKNYPLDSLLIRSEARSVHEVCRRIEQGLYIMDPDFQRDFIWDAAKQSRLMESLLMRIPLPVFYLAEREDGKIIVIDGLQRLTTISNYLKNLFPLRHLDKANKPFAGKLFRDLPVKLQTRLEDSQLIIYILDEKVPERARLDIFERVNGGVPLSRQQMRNCMYCGPATKVLANLAASRQFKDATGASLNWRTMRDREFVNRFMAFWLFGWNSYKGDMDQYLADALSHMNKMPSNSLRDLENSFLQSMISCHLVWGGNCFRKPQVAGQQRKNVINAALFDILSIYMTQVSPEKARMKKKAYRESLTRLSQEKDFIASITTSTNSQKQVFTRFGFIDKAFAAI